jgi:hypothetical protein
LRSKKNSIEKENSTCALRRFLDEDVVNSVPIIQLKKSYDTFCDLTISH